jgi:CheY-like chemotaxis protein
MRPGHDVALILVVDDEYSITEVLEAALIDAGHEMISAMNGQQALERLHQRRPDLILLDLMMPIMDGAAMLDAMRKDPAGRDIPVIIMSSLAEAAIPGLVKAPYRAFLRKPFKLRALIDAVNRALELPDRSS